MKPLYGKFYKKDRKRSLVWGGSIRVSVNKSSSSSTSGSSSLSFLVLPDGFQDCLWDGWGGREVVTSCMEPILISSVLQVDPLSFGGGVANGASLGEQGFPMV